VLARKFLLRLAGFGAAIFALACGLVVFAGLQDNLHPADLAVVLGNKVDPDGTPSVMLQARLDHAAELYRQGDCKQIFVSGGHGREGYDEPVVMKEALEKEGVPAEAIFEDNDGLTTWQTAQNTARFLREHHLHSVLIVSQYFHLPRCRLAFAKFGIAPVYWSHAPFWNIRDLISVPREVIGYADYAVRQPHPRTTAKT
jgi:vancomycin permeability regulator SanA